jgi:serine phosphatase RsbU (regulator of sigma subunit)
MGRQSLLWQAGKSLVDKTIAVVSTTEELSTQLSQERYALTSLLEFARTLTPDLGPEGIIRSVLRTAMGRSLITEAFAYLESPRQEKPSGEYLLTARAGFAGELLPEKIEQKEFDELLADRARPFTIVPLVAADGAGYLGMLGFGKSINPRLRDETEATYLASLAALTSIALTNAWLFEREKERERLESELRLARDIQRSLLPQHLPEFEEIEIAAISRPSEWVGGDYYDVIELSTHHVLLCVADVVGKGIAAALTMSNLQAALRTLVGLIREGHLDLLDAIKELNRLMCESTASDRFITAAIGILDLRSRRFECVVCGHPNPVIAMQNGEIISIESTGIPLGIMATFPYESRTYSLTKASLLLFYTDGLSEAKYGTGMVGKSGIRQVLEQPAILSGDLPEALRRLVDSPGITVEDDITVLAVRFRQLPAD